MTPERFLNNKEIPNTVFAGSKPIQREAFIRSVAVAVGRVSPNVEYKDEDVIFEVKNAPTVEQAEIAGNLILVAEDNLTNQDVINRQLNLLGYAVEMFEDGKKALEAYKSKHYAILLTDCHMPVMDGFHLTGKIRELEKEGGRRLPIIAITASTLESEVDRCYSAGMDDFLSKPIEMTKFKILLRKWMPESKLEPKPKPKPKPEPLNNVSKKVKNTGSIINGSIDPAQLKSMFGDDDEAFKEILVNFVEPATLNVDEIEAAFADHSADGVAKAAHKLQSSARSVGANELADLCQTLETAGNADDWDQICEAVPKIPQTMISVTEYIDKL